MSKLRTIISVIAFTCAIFIMMTLSGCEDIIPPAPDVPTITYAEFPFTLVYELDGEEITLEDTVICEYAGNVWDGSTAGRYRVWDMRFEDGEDFILRNLGEGEFIGLAIGCTPSYLMGDLENPSYNCGNASAYYTKFTAEGGRHDSFFTYDELYENYGIKIISFEIAPPIENTFVPAE